MHIFHLVKFSNAKQCVSLPFPVLLNSDVVTAISKERDFTPPEQLAEFSKGKSDHFYRTKHYE